MTGLLRYVYAVSFRVPDLVLDSPSTVTTWDTN
jgi:hypothetical protein